MYTYKITDYIKFKLAILFSSHFNILYYKSKSNYYMLKGCVKNLRLKNLRTIFYFTFDKR